MEINKSILRQIIIDHYNNPNHKNGIHNDKNLKSMRANSESCIDDLTIEVKVVNNIVKHFSFDGIACAICTSSTDIIGGMILNRTVEDANKLINEYYKMIKNEKFDASLIKEAVAFENIHKQPSRIKCATLGISAIEKLINEK